MEKKTTITTKKNEIKEIGWLSTYFRSSSSGINLAATATTSHITYYVHFWTEAARHKKQSAFVAPLGLLFLAAFAPPNSNTPVSLGPLMGLMGPIIRRDESRIFTLIFQLWGHIIQFLLFCNLCDLRNSQNIPAKAIWND